MEDCERCARVSAHWQIKTLEAVKFWQRSLILRSYSRRHWHRAESGGGAGGRGLDCFSTGGLELEP